MRDCITVIYVNARLDDILFNVSVRPARQATQVQLLYSINLTLLSINVKLSPKNFIASFSDAFGDLIICFTRRRRIKAPSRDLHSFCYSNVQIITFYCLRSSIVSL